MTADIHQEAKCGQWADRDTMQRFLSDDEVDKLNRDLRILIASNGTLTRILGVVANDEIVLEIIDQQIHGIAPTLGSAGGFLSSRRSAVGSAVGNGMRIGKRSGW
jgi:hypothetical protein